VIVKRIAKRIANRIAKRGVSVVLMFLKKGQNQVVRACGPLSSGLPCQAVSPTILCLYAFFSEECSNMFKAQKKLKKF
jgi:hypothetical protein